VHLADPPSGQTGERGEILGPGQPLRIEAAHLAGRGSTPSDRPVADYPAHRWNAAQSIGVIHILVVAEPSEHRLTQQAAQGVPTVPARARIGASVGQAKGVIQLAIDQQPAIGGGHTARNWSIRRRSKSSLSAPSVGLPAGSTVTAPPGRQINY
jgi:hypothetical protein